MRGVRAVRGWVTGAAGVVGAGALAGVLFRFARPRQGGLALLALAGLAAVTALIAGAFALEAAEKRARRALSLDQAAAAYLRGCAAAGGMNCAAGAFTVVVIFLNGVSEGLWLPDLMAAGLNLWGAILAMPRVRHLRRLYYTPTLPWARL
jgi:hypothetical protein